MPSIKGTRAPHRLLIVTGLAAKALPPKNLMRLGVPMFPMFPLIPGSYPQPPRVYHHYTILLIYIYIYI